MSCVGYIIQYFYQKETEEKKQKQVHTTGEKMEISDSSLISSFSPPSPVGTNCSEVA